MCERGKLSKPHALEALRLKLLALLFVYDIMYSLVHVQAKRHVVFKPRK